MLSIEFGSMQRGDSDLSSDRDILLIASDWDLLSKEKAIKTTQGYSVSCFTKETSSYLMESGSLFFKHVIDEGVLVHGSESEYQLLTRKWNHAKNYQDEIDSNIDLLEVLDFIPESNSGMVAAVDIIICSIRNVLIRKLAHSGIHVFSWKDVLDKAADMGLICEKNTKLFLIARAIKNLYRQGQIRPVPLSFIDRLVDSSKLVFDGSINYNFSKRKHIQTFTEKCHDGSYKQLRAIELLCAAYDFDSSMQNYLDWIKEPSYFTSRGPNHREHRTQKRPVTP
jgi:hypothetical protein